jgi:hypothetical protein
LDVAELIQAELLQGVRPGLICGLRLILSR